MKSIYLSFFICALFCLIFQSPGKAKDPPRFKSSHNLSEFFEDYWTFGGSKYDYPADGDIDSDGMIYMTGYTFSTDFPLQNAFQDEIKGDTTIFAQDAFFLKFDTASGELIASTYLGGTGIDGANAIAVDSRGWAYMAGQTYSTDFPMFNAVKDSIGGSTDGFLACIDAVGNLVATTYFGEDNFETIHDIVIDIDSSVWIVGQTIGLTGLNPIQPPGASYDGFIAHYSPGLEELLFATPFGGDDIDNFRAIYIDSSFIYIAGESYSADFPLANPWQGSLKGSGDAVLLKLNKNTFNLEFSTFYGGSDFEEGHSLAMDSSGNLFIAGRTASNDLIVKGAFQAESGGNIDGFIAAFDGALDSLLYSSYIGGESAETVTEVFTLPDNRLSFLGTSFSDDFPEQNGFGMDSTGTPHGFIGYGKILVETEPFFEPDYLTPVTNVGGIQAGFPTFYGPGFIGVDKETEDLFAALIKKFNSPDLLIRKQISSTYPTVGDTVTFTIEVVNRGFKDAENTILTDILDKDIYTLVSVGGEGCMIDEPGNSAIVQCDLNTLEVEDTVFIEIEAVVKTGGLYTNEAAVYADDHPEVRDETTFLAGEPELEIEISATDSTPRLGENFAFFVTIRNTGNASATNINITNRYNPYKLSFQEQWSSFDLDSTLAPFGNDVLLKTQHEMLLPGDSIRIILWMKPTATATVGEGLIFTSHLTFDQDPVIHGDAIALEAQKPFNEIIAMNILGAGGYLGQQDIKSSLSIQETINLDIYIDSLKVFENLESGKGTFTDILLSDITPLIHLVESNGDFSQSIHQEELNWFSGSLLDSLIQVYDSVLFIVAGKDSAAIILVPEMDFTSENPAMTDIILIHTYQGYAQVTIANAAESILAENMAFKDYERLYDFEPQLQVLNISSHDQHVQALEVDLSNMAGNTILLALLPLDTTENNSNITGVAFAQNGDEILPLDIVSPENLTKVQVMKNLSEIIVMNHGLQVTLTKPDHLQVNIYDLSGRLLQHNMETYYPSGRNFIPISKNHLKPGIYLYKISTTSESVSIKAINQ